MTDYLQMLLNGLLRVALDSFLSPIMGVDLL
jgi:hypothetical protein